MEVPGKGGSLLLIMKRTYTGPVALQFMRRAAQFASALALLCATPLAADLVINEIMYAPYEPWPMSQEFPTTNRTEYVEIYNAGTGTVDLTNYRLDNGLSFDFPASSTLAPGAYIVVAENLQAFTNAYPAVANVVGGAGGRLNNGGERLTLSRREGGNWVTADTIRYLDDPGSDGTGYSLELVNPSLAHLRNQYYGDWVTSLTISGTPGVVNSTFDATPPPVLGDVRQEPPLPHAGGVVLIEATVATNDLLDITIRYRVTDSPAGNWSNRVMLDDGEFGDTVPGDGVYSLELPFVTDTPMLEGDVMEFQIDVTTTHGSRTFPATNRSRFVSAPFSYHCKFAEDTYSDVA